MVSSRKGSSLFTLVLVALMSSTSIRSVFAETTGTCSVDDETCTTPDTEVCEDHDEECPFWAEENNECENNPSCEYRFDSNRFWQATKNDSSSSISHSMIPFVAPQICMSIVCEVAVCVQIKCRYRHGVYVYVWGSFKLTWFHAHLVFVGLVFGLFGQQYDEAGIGRS